MGSMVKASLFCAALLVCACAIEAATTVTPVYVRSGDYNQMNRVKQEFSKAASVFATWTATNPCVNWRGVTCDSNGYVTSIVLKNAGIFNGALSSHVTALSKLTELSLPGNGIIGRIPESIGALKNLVTLNLAFNYINNTIPSGIKVLTKLSTIILSYNQLTGIIPTGIAPGRVLTTLKLDHNQLVGRIPTQLTSHYAKGLPYTLDFSSNYLTGGFNIKFEGRYLTLNMSNNYLTGTTVITKTLGHHCATTDFSNNCLSRAFVKTSCSANKVQKTKRACASFCEATYANDGACRKGVCYPPSGTKKKPFCRCNSGKSNKVDKYVCK
eukprot:TRINITY_DN225_c1_g2_i1.p1 TRINITY_DN225_c1_g2~~TRINITY_DN225_c1_g2_i1.p1  ORF type:complete len:326 (+),score=26.99 TRINITY_DN225_c1_g2_i1:229-1206(+)